MCRGDFGHRARHVRDVLAFEVTRLREVVISAEEGSVSLSQTNLNLLDVPDKKLAFVTFRVCVLGRIKTSGRISHLVQHVIEDPRHRVARQLFLTHLKVVKIEPGEKGIVVEHLLEVRHEPFCVCRVTMKTAAELIVDAAVRHFLTGVTNDFERIAIACASMCAEQKLQCHCRRKFWRTTEAAVHRVVTPDDAGVRRIE